MKTKLTMVSVYSKGRKCVKFVNLMANEYGKFIAPISLINQMLNEIGCYGRGVTYTIG